MAQADTAALLTREPHIGTIAAMTLLSFFAIMLLPRQFHVTVVENNNEQEIKRAAWLFPLYLVLINLFVIPIALAGLLIFRPGQVDSDMFVLALPAAAGSDVFTLIAFVGGLSAATAMVIVETVALAIMVSNDIVVPLVLQRRESFLSNRVNVSTLLLTVRHATHSRAIDSSADGGETWGPPAPQNVTDPNCQASLIAVHAPGAGARRLLFANPHTSGLLPSPYGRLNVTVQASDDGGATWAPILVVDPGPSAYTALAQLAPAGAGPASCAIMYEWSDDYPVDFFGISFLTFDCALPPLAS